jgi:hypothetical protein
LDSNDGDKETGNIKVVREDKHEYPKMIAATKKS